MENQKQLDKDLKTELQVLDKTEQDKVLDWAIQVQKIQNDNSLSKKEKIQDLKKLNNIRAFKSVIVVMSRFIKNYWAKASWAQRLGIIGVGGGIAFASSSGAGIAALGGAIGIPLFLLTAAGGTFIGTLIDGLKKKQ